MPHIKLQPQVGPQEAFHKSKADIVFYGGAAGGGKTWSILAEPLRHLKVAGFGTQAVISIQTLADLERLSLISIDLKIRLKLRWNL